MGSFGAQPSYQFRAGAGLTAADGATSWSDWATGIRFTVAPMDDNTATAMKYGGSGPPALAGAFGGAVHSSDARGSNLQLTVTVQVAGTKAAASTKTFVRADRFVFLR